MPDTEILTDAFGIAVTAEELERWDQLLLSSFLQGLMEGDVAPAERFRSIPPNDGDATTFFRDIAPGLDATSTPLKRVLEFGCGTGRIASRCLGGAVEQYVGLDVSRFAICAARGRMDQHRNCRFLHTVDDKAAIHRLGEFSVVFAHTAFMHLPPRRAEKVLRWLCGHVACGGWLSIDVRTKQGHPGAPEEESWCSGDEWTTFPDQQELLCGAASEEGLSCRYYDDAAGPAGPRRGYVIGRRP